MLLVYGLVPGLVGALAARSAWLTTALLASGLIWPSRALLRLYAIGQSMVASASNFLPTAASAGVPVAVAEGSRVALAVAVSHAVVIMGAIVAHTVHATASSVSLNARALAAKHRIVHASVSLLPWMGALGWVALPFHPS